VGRTTSVVLVLGGEDDAHAMHVLRHLQAVGVDAVLLDSRWFPTTTTLSVDPCGAGAMGLPGGREVPFAAVRSVYWRAYAGVRTPDLPDPQQSFVAGNDARGLFETLFLRLDARWVNGWRAYQLHQTKPAQLAMVASLGVAVPASLITNDPERLRAFAARHRAAIFKPVQGGAHAQRLAARHLTDANLENLRIAPVTVQEEVPGTNVRVFVAGERVLACEIRTAALDYREDEAPAILAHPLPDRMREPCLAIARTLDLLWTGMDFRLTPEGRYVFLEANPSPMFLGFEASAGLPLTEVLGELLTGSTGPAAR
jgi:hypothetical protein